jgi:phage-related protein
MADERSAVEDFLNDSKLEQSDVDLIPEEKQVAVEEDAVEKPLRFDKDPKVQRFIEKQVEKRLKDFKPEVREVAKEESLGLPDSFVELVGNDTPQKQKVLKDLSNYFGTLKGEARQEFLAEMQEQQRVEAQRDNEVLQELNEGFEEIEDTHGVDLSSNTPAALKTRAAFVDYLKKVSHKNAEGEVDQFADIPAAWEEFQSRQTKSPNRAKALASRSLGSSQAVSDSPQQGRDYSWKGVEKYFGSLSNKN